MPPDRNYLICVFPHGWLRYLAAFDSFTKCTRNDCNVVDYSLGAGVTLASSHSKWSQLFPGIRPKCTTVGFSMYYPIQREILLNSGFSSASENALTTLLSQSNAPNDDSNCDGYTSNGVGLIVGGVPEAFYTYPNAYKCYLKKRRGFVRVALQTGAALVPAISFGENDMYDVVQYKAGSWFRIFQDTFKRYANVTPIHFNGRGCLQYKFGLLPKRRPITLVIGEAIHLRKTSNPTKYEINQIHEYFCKQLNKLFEAHKSKYVKDFEKVFLEIV